MNKIIDSDFDELDESVFTLYPVVHTDSRGWFAEMLRADGKYIANVQMNRSCSKPGVIRGCHALKSPFCLAKLVEAVNEDIFDIITDVRPDSSTFGKSKYYLLSAKKQNKLYVPHGFLHAFVVPLTAKNDAYFNYVCDNVYDKDSEVCIRPFEIVLPLLAKIHKEYPFVDANISKYTMSEKDVAGVVLSMFMLELQKENKKTRKAWYE